MNPTSIQSVARFSLSALTIGILAACGGGSGSDGLDIADGGIRGTGSSVGPVSGFGSVFVNGVRFDTDDIPNRAVNSDDGIGFESELDEGMILRVDGEWQENDQGTARELEYDDTLRGPIVVIEKWDEINRTGKISIHGLEVDLNRQTVVKGKNVTELSDDDIVRVSGWRLSGGDFRASFIRVQSDAEGAFDTDNEIELEGEISSFISNPCSFVIGSVLVNCNDQSLQFETINRADLTEGLFIEVEGDMPGNELFAREIRQDDQRRYRRGIEDDIEFSGPVNSSFDGSDDTFTINGLVVNVTADTEFDDDLTAEDLVSGLLVQVEGTFQEDGTVNADEIELREANAEVEGAITSSVDSAARTFEVGGVLVQVTPLTLIEDDEESRGQTVDQLFESLNTGDEVEIEGIERDSNGNVFLEALKIEREEPEDDGSDGEGEFELEGKLRETGPDSITVLGVRMKVDYAALGCTRDELQHRIDSQAGSLPKVEVDYESTSSSTGFTYAATEIELDDGDDEIECDD